MKNVIKEVDNKLTEIKPMLMKELRYLDGKGGLAVKVYACHDEEVTTFDVEVQLRENGEYKTCWISETFTCESDDTKAEKEAVKRAKQVLKSAKNWVQYISNFDIREDIEVYT